ncbi:MAG: GAF domain-containing protein [Gammaproteobacteria bacterium]
MTSRTNESDPIIANEINAYLAEVFERRVYERSLDQIVEKFPNTDRNALTAQLGDMARRLDSLIHATNKSHESLSLDSMLVRIVPLITEAFDADRSSLFLYDAETDELFSRVAQGELINEIRFDANAGIAGSVFQSNETLVVNNAYADPVFKPDIELRTGYKTQTILCVPDKKNGDTIGLAEVLNKREALFTEADASLLRAFTTHIAAAVENSHLAERAQVSIREESRVMEVTQAISSELDIDRLLRKIMSISSELLDAERSTLFLHDSTKGELWSRVAEGLEHKEIRFPAHAGIAGEVFTRREAVNIPDAYADDRFNPAIDRDTGFKTRSILCVPVVGKHGAPIGVVQVLDRHGGPSRNATSGVSKC